MKSYMKTLKRMWKAERGITGLETAIILIAFVVVASVFAYTVLSAGIFSSQKGKEAINSGLEAARSSMTLVGSTIAQDVGSTGHVTKVVFTVADAIDGSSVDWTASPSNVVTINYVDSNQRVSNITWAKTQVGKGNSNDLLDPGEKFEVAVDLTSLSPTLGANTNFTLEVVPPQGSTLTVNRTTPAYIDPVMDLH